MKRILVVLFSTIVLTLPAFGDGFYSVHSPNGNDVLAVGNGGIVFHSFDGGLTWTSSTHGSAALRAVYTFNLNVWIAGDNGSCYSSTDGGNTWSTQTLAGGASLKSVVFVDAQTGWIAGASGTILKTTNGGSSWTSQTSGTSQQLNALTFVDAQTGFAAGASGTLLKTTNGGATWVNISQVGWIKEIFSVSTSEQTMYVAGADGFCYKSTNDGSTWTELDFKTDSKSDVNDVFATTRADAYFVGGGGFIRTSADAGTTYNYGIHQMHAKLNDVFFYSTTNGWACSEKNNAILRTTDAGATWQLPQSTTVNYQWVNKVASLSSIGNTFVIDPWNKNRIFMAGGNVIYVSNDRGETWATAVGKNGGGGSQWSLLISPKDSNLWLAATSGSPKGVKRSTNAGATWTSVLARNFTSFGMPLEMDPDHPDTVIFAAEGTVSGPDGILYSSTNFGATWDTLAQTTFRSPCDIVIVPGNTSLWYVGDGTTGSGSAQMWRSTNSGHTWNSIYSSSSSEIPMIAVSRLRNTFAFATAWSATSYTKTTNSGLSWSGIAPTGSSWGTDIAKDDPNVVMYGVYGGSTSYLSTNAGVSFSSSALSGSNSGMLCYDRATFLVHQTGALFKYSITYTVPLSSVPTVTVTSPNGGETWVTGALDTIRWNSSNLTGNVKIELSRNGGTSYETIVASTANDGVQTWIVTGPSTSSARVRVSSVNTPSVADVNNNAFTISSNFALFTKMYLHDNGGAVDSLEFGTGASASDGIDASFGEYELPPLPPTGVMDVRWQVAGTLGTDRDIRDTLGGTHQQILYTGKLQAGDGGYPFVLKWNRAELPAGTFTLRDGPTGFFFLVNMKLQDSLVITDDQAVQFQIVYDAGNAVTSTAQTGWNILSLPVTVGDRRKTVVFPTSTSNAFAYTSIGYVNRDTLDYGVGYWLKFPSTQPLSLSGGAITSDTVDVGLGWNIIGSISSSVPVGSIVQVPGGIVASSYFGYGGAGYTPATSIDPMRGYWVKVNQTGKLVLPGSTARPSGKLGAR